MSNNEKSRFKILTFDDIKEVSGLINLPSDQDSEQTRRQSTGNVGQLLLLQLHWGHGRRLALLSRTCRKLIFEKGRLNKIKLRFLLPESIKVLNATYPASRHVIGLCCRVDDVINGLHWEVESHKFAHRFQASLQIKSCNTEVWDKTTPALWCKFNTCRNSICHETNENEI